MQNPILVALDVSDVSKAKHLVDELAPVVGGFKIGSELFTKAGPDMVRHVRASSAQVFLDLKFHDIPNTVAGAVRSANEMDVQMLTIHTAGGSEMMKAAVAAAGKGVLVLGVTVLTSMDASEMNRIGIAGQIGNQVDRLVRLGLESGLRGFVCSALEVAALRPFIPKETVLVTPGIRSNTDEKGDQKRTLSAAEAISAGANWLVIGRPIISAANPAAAAREILESLKK